MRLANSSLLAFVAFAARWRGTSAFVAPSSLPLSRVSTVPFARRFAAAAPLRMAESASLPTVEQASRDPFMKQLSHASDICALIESGGEEQLLSDLLKAQLSHSDGIRGFFATYLTGEGDSTAADRDEIPAPLRKAMEEANPNDLIPLACMNVVMPTAMRSMHTDPELSAGAAKTAQRGKRILASLRDNASVQTNCDAIFAAATDGDMEGCDEGRVKYWGKFFENYGYKEEQRRDIAKAVQGFKIISPY